MTIKPASASDYWEYIANTDPTDSNIVFRVTENFMQTNGSYFSLVFNASYNREYYIWYTESLTAPVIWSQYNGYPFSGTGHYEEYGVDITGKTNCSTGSKCRYRPGNRLFQLWRDRLRAEE